MTQTPAVFRVGSVLLAAALAFACKNPVSGGTPGGSTAGESPSAVVAEWNGKKVTLKEVDDAHSAELEDLDKKRFDVRKHAVDEMIIKDLVKAAATKVGKSENEWLKANIEDKVPAPHDAEIAKVYEENKERMPAGSTLEQMKPQIISYLTGDQRRKVAESVFDALKKEAGVKISLVEPVKAKKEVEAKGPARGPDSAKVTIVEFSDFQCPFCKKAHDTVEEVMTAYAGKVKLVFRQFPLEFHQNAAKAAEAALCANEQGQFWKFHDELFKNQDKLTVDDLKKHAQGLGLDSAKFNACLEGGQMASVVSTDQAAGQKVGVSGTPAFFINGVMLSGAQPMEEFKKVIDAELAAK